MKEKYRRSVSLSTKAIHFDIIKKKKKYSESGLRVLGKKIKMIGEKRQKIYTRAEYNNNI